MTHDLVFRVAVALLAGAHLATKTHEVGSHTRSLSWFACWHRAGDVVYAPEHVRVFTPVELRPGKVILDEDIHVAHDWSAYGAARAFVNVSSARAVRQALAQWEKARSRALSGQPRG